MATVIGSTKAEFDKAEMAKRAGKKDTRSQDAKDFDLMMSKAKNSQRVSKAIEESKPVHMGNWMKTYKENEERNAHSENAVRLTNLVGNVPHHEEALGILERHNLSDDGISREDQKRRDEISKEHYPKAQSMHSEWKKYNK